MSPVLNFADTMSVSDAIAAAGAPKGAVVYPSLARSLNSIRIELKQLQEERLAYSDNPGRGRMDVAAQLERATTRVAREPIEERLAAHDARTKRRLAEFAAKAAAARARNESDGRCAVKADEFLAVTLGQGKRLRDTLLPTPRLLPEGLAATIGAKRAEITANDDRRLIVEQACATPLELKAAISKAVAAEASKGRPPFDPRIRGGRDPSKLADGLVLGIAPGVKSLMGDGGRSFLVWLLADLIEVRLHSLVDNADLTAAMSDAEQAHAIAALTAERLAFEREEEALIRLGEAQAMTIARRADADPRAVLMVEVRE